MSLPKVIDNYSATIVGSFASGATTITVSAPPTVITSGYLTIFDLNGDQLEKIKFTGVSGNDLTGCIRGLSFTVASDTPPGGLAQALQNGMEVKLSDSVSYYNPIVDVLNGTTPSPAVMKNPATRTITDSRHLTDKEYVDGISNAGIISMLVSDNGGTTVNINSGTYLLNGAVEEYAGAAAQALTDDDTNYVQLVDGVLDINITGFSDDAIPLAEVVCASGDITSLLDKRPFYTGVDVKANSGLGRDTTGIYIDLATDPGLQFTEGKLGVKVKNGGGFSVDTNGLYLYPASFFFTSATTDYVLDGVTVPDFATLDGTTYTLTADANGGTITVDSGITLITKGYGIYCSKEFINNGTIHNNGGAGGNASGMTGGIAGVAQTAGTFQAGKNGKAGANGQTSNLGGINGVNGDTQAARLGPDGSAGGSGGVGGAYNTGGGTGGAAGGGTIEALNFASGYADTKTVSVNTETINTKSLSLLAATSAANFSSSSGSGSGGSGGSWGGGVSYGAGGSGAGGGVIVIEAPTITNNGTIESKGGNGGNAGPQSTGQSGGSGGGAGGSGGVIILVYSNITLGTLTVTGGVGGTASACAPGIPGGGSFNNAANGGNGLTGNIYKLKL